MSNRLACTERLAIACVAAAAAAPIALHALWRPLGVGSGAFASIPASLLSTLAVLVPLVCAALFAALAGVPARARLTLVAGLLLGAVAALVLGVPRGALVPLLPPFLTAGLIAGFGLLHVADRLPASLDGAARRRPWASALWAVLGLVVVVQSARLSTFMADPAITSASALPTSEFYKRHACVTAYVNAAALTLRGAANVYDDAISGNDPALPNPPAAIDIGSFTLDSYEYPPPFLLLPRLALAFTRDFFTLRTVWFALQAGLLAFASVRMAHWIGGRGGLVAGLLAPLVWVSIPSLIGLQIGNFQVSAVALAVLAMVAFEERRPAVGGALLAFTVISKLAPGLLVVHLLARKRWHDVAWFSGFAIFYSVAALWVLGPDAFVAFATYQLPRLSSGEAFSFLDKTPSTIAANLSIFAIPIKLRTLGVPGMSWAVSSVVAWLYTLITLGLAVLSARSGAESRRLRGCAWLALLSLGALRSPFAPGYVVISTLWLLTLLTAEVRDARGAGAIVACWLAVTTILPLPHPRVAFPISLGGQLVGFALLFWVLLRRPRSTEEEISAERGSPCSSRAH